MTIKELKNKIQFLNDDTEVIVQVVVPTQPYSSAYVAPAFTTHSCIKAGKGYWTVSNSEKETHFVLVGRTSDDD